MKKPVQAKAESAAAKATTSAVQISKARRWDHWWHCSPFMALDHYGHYAAKSGAEFWYDNFWKPRRLSAWVYELVRRLPKLKLKNPKLPAQDLARLRSLPPYPQLTSFAIRKYA